MNDVTLVAFYGNKPAELTTLIQKLQQQSIALPLLEGKFIPYRLEQVHGTIIGCEGLTSDRGIISRWYKENRNESRQIDFAGALDYLQQRVEFPITIRFGGYDRQTDYDFLSRGLHPDERSFQLQSAGDDAIPVLIGWSWQGDRITPAIDNLRRGFQQFNLLHKYHATEDAVDNDFYLRLGTIEGNLTVAERENIAIEIRHLLEGCPIKLPLTLNDLAFARYRDLQLTPATTKVIPASSITAVQLEQLYID